MLNEDDSWEDKDRSVRMSLLPWRSDSNWCCLQERVGFIYRQMTPRGIPWRAQAGITTTILRAAVHEIGVIRASPLKPHDSIMLWRSKGFMGRHLSMMQRDASLSGSCAYTPDHCSFPSLCFSQFWNDAAFLSVNNNYHWPSLCGGFIRDGKSFVN